MDNVFAIFLGLVGAGVSLALPLVLIASTFRHKCLRPLRNASKSIPHSAFERLLLVCIFCGLVHYGATKETNGTDRASGGAPVLRDTPGSGDGGGTNSILRFTSIGVGSNEVSLALAWTTNFSPARAWLELHWDSNLLSNCWHPLLSHEITAGETNTSFEIAITNDTVPSAFFRACVDTLELTFGGGCDTYLREDGTRIHVATHTGQFPVTVLRSDRPAGLSAPDPAFAANPFAYTVGLSYDPDDGTICVASNGTYRLPDGSELFVSSEPTVTFGSPHTYTGPDYPLDSPSLRDGWTRGDSPLTGCSCVPETDFGGGLVVRGDAPPSRGGVDGLPDGMHLEYDYRPGGVWVTCLAGTNVVWRKWAPHNYLPEYGGSWNELDEPEECDCDCGDDTAEGPSVGSVRFRIPLGSPYAGITSGFLYFNQSEEFAPTPSSFRLMARGDANVSDTMEDGVRTVSCFDFRGRTLVISPIDGEDAVEVEVRDTASGSLLHTWSVSRGYYGGMTFVKTSILGNTMEHKTISSVYGGWEERDEISDVTETRSVRDEDGVMREERIVECGGTVVSHVITDSSQIGTGANAVMRQTERRELGAGGAWKTSQATYWNDPTHPLRHGCLRLVRGDDRAWTYTAFDDAGRETFRLEQRGGSAAPADSAGYSLSNLPQGVDAFATVFGYEPLEGDSAHTNDFASARTESKYVVSGGAATLISRTWRRYVHSETNGLPVVTAVKTRACSQSAGMDAPDNAVSSETTYDAQSGLVPYVLRGRPLESIGEDGTVTLFETGTIGDVVRTVERRFVGDVEAPTRRVSDVDFRHGNLLYEATSLTADGTEFGWRQHVYDEKNRLRSTTYDDGTSETNAYSCCRLLWSSDRHGARRVRHAQTGTDHIRHSYVEASVVDLPKDPYYHYGPWSDGTFRQHSPVTVHLFDGIGRETNTIVRTGKLDGDTLTLGTSPTRSGFISESHTAFPQGVSDVSETVGFRGLVTHRTVSSAQSAETKVEEEFVPGEASPSVIVTNIALRGGGTVEWRGRSGKWTRSLSFADYAADGTQRSYDITESSDSGTVTNFVTAYDFLGRVASVTTPTATTTYAYDGASPRRLSSVRDSGGSVSVSTTYLYDEAGEQVGAITGGVAEERRTTYEFFSNAWWRVERSAQIAGGVTNSPSATWTRLTGLSDELRSEVVELRDGAVARRTVSSYDADAGTERETVYDAAAGESWTTSKFGYPIETGTPTHVVTNFYGPVGKVFIRTLHVPGETSRRVEEMEVDALGDEICRVVCDRQDIVNAPESEFAYDCRGNRSIVTNAVGVATYALYDPDGNAVAESGATYPTETDYDTAGRRIALRTTRGGESWDETRWGYDAATGSCTNKTYADGSHVEYTHTPDELPLRTTYASGRWRENAYDGSRRLVQVSHSDPSLDYAVARDAFGRATNVTDAAGREWRYEHDAFDAVLREETASASLSRAYDSVGRLTGLALTVNGNPKGGVGYEYAAEGVLSVVSNADVVVSYAYTPDRRDAGYSISFADGGTFTRTLNRDSYRRDLVTSVSNGCGAASQTLGYAYDALSRPVSRNADTFAYNDRSEVVSAQIGANLFAHAYDCIGNHTLFTANATTNTYAANNVNQYTAILRDSATLREPIHDVDGNMTSDGMFSFSYDAANRLTSIYSNGVVLIANQYDYRGRRIRKTTPTTETTFVYDGWDLLYEQEVVGEATNETFYCWGKDLSGRLQGAGGVGGLLYIRRNGTIYIPHADAYGNILRYTDTAGSIVAEYTYDAFGKTIAQSGPMADVFRHRFSTKYYDSETDLYYYGYRFYSSALMRWLNRDPIEEEGGLNLYGFCENCAISMFDGLGLNVTLTTGNHNASWWQIGNRFLHQEICVDTWSWNKKSCCWKRTGRSCFSFMATGIGFGSPGDNWLDMTSTKGPGILRGEVYSTEDQGLENTETLETTVCQDMAFLAYLISLDGKKDTYSVLRHSCRTFSQAMLNEAKHRSAANGGCKNGKKCE